MTSVMRIGVRELLLTRSGLAFVEAAGTPAREQELQAVELELAEVGYVLSSRLRRQLARCSLEQLVGFRSWVLATLLEKLGGAQQHVPLFRRFPEGIPSDTLDLYWRKVLVHFAQDPDQPCLFCCRVGTTHVLTCGHVVCDDCFDGSSYSACPVCEQHVGPSPFFKPAPVVAGAPARAAFKLLDLGASLVAEARALFLGLCARKQALSPDDRRVLIALVEDYPREVLGWLPAKIPARENVALVFGTLAKHGNPVEVIEHAAPFLGTATDVLRFIAVLSGTDGSLQRESRIVYVARTETHTRFWGRRAAVLAAVRPSPGKSTLPVAVSVARFKIAKLSRALRRALLALLDAMHEDRLIEDLLRHRSYWVWVGEFLHPHEYAARFPRAARGFQIVRKQAADGSAAPAFRTWNAQRELALQARDIEQLLRVLVERPGELARHLDCALRAAPTDADRARVIATFVAKISHLATPVLVTLRNHLSLRGKKADIRVYWPKGKVARGVSAPDNRAALPDSAIAATVAAIEAELLLRFANKPAFKTCLIDEALETVLVPFNERTASSSAVSLPRGSRITVPNSNLMRLFLHWCEPRTNGRETDLDLSLGFFDQSWQTVGVCSYYQLQFTSKDGTLVAQSAGDLQDAPWPEGASEFVDVHCEAARAAGARYAVMVVNAYRGMPFSQLERGFAGLMLSQGPLSVHFDPTAVELKFDLAGENGIFLPLVLDLRQGVLHWLDVQSKGELELNNLATSRSKIAKICPNFISYFESGTRPSMFQLGLLHAAARSPRVILRGALLRAFVRHPEESVTSFYARLVSGSGGEVVSEPLPNDGLPTLALLYRGDLDLPPGSAAYALFRDRLVPTISASDLLS